MQLSDYELLNAIASELKTDLAGVASSCDNPTALLEAMLFQSKVVTFDLKATRDEKNQLMQIVIDMCEGRDNGG